MEKQKRAGQTKVTSVSIPYDLLPLIEKFNISPTLALKKGIGIELYHRGHPNYQSELNAERMVVVEKQTKDLQAYINALQKNREVIDKLRELDNFFSKTAFQLKFMISKLEDEKEANKT